MDTRPRHTTERLDEAIVLRQEAAERRRCATPGTEEFRDAQAEEERLSKRVLDLTRRRTRTLPDLDRSSGTNLL